MSVDVDRFKRLLDEERQRIVQAIDFLHEENPGTDDETHADTAGNDNHFADTATETVDRQMDYSLEENSEQVLADIDHALERIEAGSYGTCEVCGKPIGEERLTALPWARLCIDDARKQSR